MTAGLIWAYAFNHDEAIRCFERALELDQDLAIARWGIAYSIGPNYNKAWEAFDPVDLAASLARARMELGLARNGRASAIERGLIEALRARFPTDDPDDTDALLAGHASYADAMAKLAEAYPDDIDVQALAADALVNVTAWALWDTRTGEPAPGSRVVEAKRILDDALATPAGREHPGVLHLYLHTMEMSATPQDALPAADLLRGLVPDAGHLQHMASHIDVLCGDYRNSVVSNLTAVQADRLFVEREGPLNFYSLYRAHNLHFIVYSAMFEGNSAIALRAADELAGQLTPELLAIESPPMADWLEAFVPLRIHVLVRFGRWDELISQLVPDDVELYCTTSSHHPLRTRRRARSEGTTYRRPMRNGRRSPPRTTASRTPATCSTTPHATFLRSQPKCSTVKSPIGKADSTKHSPICDARSNSTTHSPTTNRGDGCNRPGTPTARCCWSRVGSRTPPRCTPPISGSIPP